MGRADDRARAVSRDRIPASDGGARRRRQPGGGAPGVRAVPTAARGGARRLPVARDRVDLPRPSRSACLPRSSGGVGPRSHRPTQHLSASPESRPSAVASRAPTRVRRQATPGRARLRRDRDRSRDGRDGRAAHARESRHRRPPASPPTRSGSSVPATAARAGRSRWGRRRARSRPGDGSIWVANVDAHSVSRVDPVKQVVIQTIQVGNGPAGIAFGGGSSGSRTASTGRSRGSTRRRTRSSSGSRSGTGPPGVAVDSRAVWVANSSDGTVTRIDRRTGRPLKTISGRAERRRRRGRRRLGLGHERVVRQGDAGSTRGRGASSARSGPGAARTRSRSG